MRQLILILPLLVLLSGCVSTKRSVKEDVSNFSHLDLDINEMRDYAERFVKKTNLNVRDSINTRAYIKIRLYDSVVDANGKQPLLAEADIEIENTDIRNEYEEDSLLTSKNLSISSSESLEKNDSTIQHAEKEKETEAKAIDKLSSKFGSGVFFFIVLIAIVIAIKTYRKN